MAKEKPSVSDLDAELAALEAELAQLGGKLEKPKAKPKATKEPHADAAPTAPASAKEKRRLGFPARKAAAAREPAAEAAPAPTPAPSTPAPSPDAAALWRHDGREWVRTVPRETRVVRRVLDEEDKPVREEPASRAELDQVTGVKAERAVSRLFGRRRSP